jgi:hypothetical protein
MPTAAADARAIDIWCNKAASLTKRLADAAKDFEYLAETYDVVRDRTANLKGAKYNAAKERVDISYQNVADTRRRLCTLQAGGQRSSRSRRRKTRRVA